MGDDPHAAITSGEIRELVQQNRALIEEVKRLNVTMAQIQDRLGATSATSMPSIPSPPPLDHGSSRQKLGRTNTVRDPFFASALKRAHPMYVVKIRTLLAPSFQHFRPHEELKAAGMLVEWREGMGAVIFCSHTWLRTSHPDSAAGDKFALLVSVLRRIQAGKLDIHPEAVAGVQLPGANKRLRLRAADLQRQLVDGYVFFDFMSIPQREAEAQQRVVISLGSYVSASSYFFVLAGPWLHENGSIRDDQAWCRRGWCRMELAANALSPSPKPMVLAKTTNWVEANSPGGQLGRDWLTYAFVGKGDFSVEADRAKLGVHLLDIINARKAIALADKDLVFYRMLQASTPLLLQGTGLEPPSDPLDSWMASMKFSSVHDGRKTGLTPLYYAVVAGRADLAEALLQRGAEVERLTRVNDPEKTIVKGGNLLAYACYFGRSRDGSDVGVAADREMVQVLLKHGANPRRNILPLKMNSMHIAVIGGNIGAAMALIDHDRELICLKSGLGLDPAWVGVLGAPSGRMMFDHVLARYPEELPRWLRGKLYNDMGCSRVADTCNINGPHHDNLLAALELGLPVNAACASTRHPMAKMLCLVGDLVARYKAHRNGVGSVSGLFAYATRCTALHVATYSGSLQKVETLLAHEADVNSTIHPKRMTALHLAAISGHEAICARLLESGAQIHLKDNRGRTCVDWARRFGHDEIVQMLRSRAEQQRATEQLQWKAPAVNVTQRLRGSAQVMPRATSDDKSMVVEDATDL